MSNTYCYIRYSSDRQKDGTSVERQKQLALDYYPALADSNIFIDAGVSGFTGENQQVGTAWDRLKRKLKGGDVLLVETHDRLSRLNLWDAVGIFGSLMSQGITVVTTNDKKAYSNSSDTQIGDVIVSALKMSTGNEESKKKSERIAASWRIRSEDAAAGGVIKIPLASWIIRQEDGFVLVNDKAAVVRQIFEMCIDGYGAASIAKSLNEAKISNFRRGVYNFKGDRGAAWSIASVYCILKNKTAYGLYTPNKNKNKEDRGIEVENYFPAVVSKEEFYKAAEKLNQRKNNSSTRQSVDFNIWQGILFCAKCGSSFHCLPKGRNNKKYLVCSGKNKAICAVKNLRNEDSEPVFRELLTLVNNAELLPIRDAELQKQIQQIAALITEKTQEKGDIEKLIIERGRKPVLLNSLVDVSDEIDSLIQQREQIEKQQFSSATMQEDKGWLLENLRTDSRDQRHKANSLIKRLGVIVKLGEALKDGVLLPCFDAYDEKKERIISIIIDEKDLIVVASGDDAHERMVNLMTAEDRAIRNAVGQSIKDAFTQQSEKKHQ